MDWHSSDGVVAANIKTPRPSQPKSLPTQVIQRVTSACLMVHKKPAPAPLPTHKRKMLAPVISIPRTTSPSKAKAMQLHHSTSPDAIKHISDQTHEFKRNVVDVVADVNSKHVLSPAHPAAPATPNRRRANGAKRAIGPEFRTAVHTITA